MRQIPTFNSILTPIVVENAQKGYGMRLNDLWLLFKSLKQPKNDNFYASKSPNSIKQPPLQQENTRELLYSLLYVEPEPEADADAEMHKIQNSVNELNEIFQSMHTLTVSQGELINRIDHNIELTANFQRSTIRQLNQAVRGAKSRGRIRKFFYSFVLMFFGIYLLFSFLKS